MRHLPAPQAHSCEASTFCIIPTALQKHRDAFINFLNGSNHAKQLYSPTDKHPISYTAIHYNFQIKRGHTEPQQAFQHIPAPSLCIRKASCLPEINQHLFPGTLGSFYTHAQCSMTVIFISSRPEKHQPVQDYYQPLLVSLSYLPVPCAIFRSRVPYGGPAPFSKAKTSSISTCCRFHPFQAT